MDVLKTIQLYIKLFFLHKSQKYTYKEFNRGCSDLGNNLSAQKYLFALPVHSVGKDLKILKVRQDHHSLQGAFENFTNPSFIAIIWHVNTRRCHYLTAFVKCLHEKD